MLLQNLRRRRRRRLRIHRSLFTLDEFPAL